MVQHPRKVNIKNIVISLRSCRTLLLRIFWTGSESSNTTNPKFGSFPPLLIRSSRTVPYSVDENTVYLPLRLIP